MGLVVTWVMFCWFCLCLYATCVLFYHQEKTKTRSFHSRTADKREISSVFPSVWEGLKCSDCMVTAVLSTPVIIDSSSICTDVSFNCNRDNEGNGPRLHSPQTA